MKRVGWVKQATLEWAIYPRSALLRLRYCRARSYAAKNGVPVPADWVLREWGGR